MKVAIGIGVLQLMVTGFLLFKVVSLEASLAEFRLVLSAQLPQSGSLQADSTRLSSSNHTSVAPPSVSQIREAIRDELEHALSNDQGSSYKALVKQKSDPELIREFESRIDYYLSDGAFSQEDMLDMENKIIQMAPADRPKMMNKLTQAMSKANIQLIE